MITMSLKKSKESGPSLTQAVLATRPSSSEVIKEAKQWYDRVKSIQTKRPSTPRDSRSLYGKSERRESRPPSALHGSGPQYFDPLDDASSSSSNPLVKSKLAPLPHKPLVPANGEPTILSKTKQSRRTSPASSSKVVTTGYVDAPKKQTRSSEVPGGGSGGNKGKETANEALYWNQNILPLIERLGGFSDQQPTDDDVTRMCTLCVALQEALERGSCFVRMSSRRRTSLLSVLFRLLNFTSRELHILCSKIILSMKISNKNLTNVCKLIFTVCREGKHDDAFINHQLLTLMLEVLQESTDPLSKYDTYEALVYLTGSIKCLTDNKAVASALYELGSIKILTDFMSTTMLAMKQLEDSKRARKFAESIVVQVCSAFCNMLNVDQKARQSICSLPILLTVCEEFIEDYEIVSVISRVLSKMTMHSSSLSAFLGQTNLFRVLLLTLRKYQIHTEVTLHVCLLFGDLTSQHNKGRDQLFNCAIRDPKSGNVYNCIDVIAQIMDIYLEISIGQLDQSNPAKTDQVASDVLVKVVRLIAHLSIGPSVGPRIAGNSRMVESLLALLESHSLDKNEEAIVNTLAALNNLSYYDENDQENFVVHHRVRLSILLSELMVADNMACVAEVVRVFGNLTKSKDVRNLLHEHKLDLMMIALLDSGDRVIVYNACGVMINMSADPDNRSFLIAEGCATKLIDVIRDFAPTEWRIGGISCQLLWNLSSDPSFIPERQLVDLLGEFLNYEIVNSRMKEIAGDPEVLNFLRASWRQDFCDFSSPLMRKLDSNQSNLVPLEGVIESDNSDNS